MIKALDVLLNNSTSIFLIAAAIIMFVLIFSVYFYNRHVITSRTTLINDLITKGKSAEDIKTIIRSYDGTYSEYEAADEDENKDVNN